MTSNLWLDKEYVTRVSSHETNRFSAINLGDNEIGIYTNTPEVKNSKLNNITTIYHYENIGSNIASLQNSKIYLHETININNNQIDTKSEIFTICFNDKNKIKPNFLRA